MPSSSTCRPASELLSLDQRLALVKKHGDFTIAWSTAVQPGLNYFGDEHGFIAYGSRWGYHFALGDPVAPRDQHSRLIQSFVASCRRRPCFVNFTAGTARILDDGGYYVNPMGVDTWLRLADYDFAGKEKEPLRYASNWLRRRGYSIRELTFADLEVNEVKALSNRWRQTRTVKDREVGLLNRPLVLEDEPDVRKFFLFDPENRLASFMVLDPIWRDGRVTGYATAIKRRLPETTGYAEQGMTRHCIDVLKSEGTETLRLGLSPLANLSDRSFRHNWLMHHGWRYGFGAWWVNRWFYNLRGHADFKRRFRGEEHPVYFGSPVLVSDLRIIAMLRLMRVF